MDYLCIMNKATKHFLRSSILACTLLLFLAFSSGLSFSLHFCDSCKHTNLFFFEHPNCCTESAHIHDSEKQCNDHSCCSSETHPTENEISNIHHDKSESCCSTKKATPKKEPCGCAEHACKTSHKYIRIASPFLAANQQLITPACFSLFTPMEILSNYDVSIPVIVIPTSNPPPLLTKAGDSSFLHFVSQNILYA